MHDSALAPAHAPRPTGRFLLAHPAHALALGFGAGLSPRAPGTVGTLWAWLTFFVLQPWMSDARWALLLLGALALGWWACSVTARNLQTPDPSCIVWDEVIAFWLVLWLCAPTHWTEQLLAFALFRYFDAAKPGPVRWADRLCHRLDPAHTRHYWPKVGLGILFDDLVAAGCTLLVLAALRLVF